MCRGTGARPSTKALDPQMGAESHTRTASDRGIALGGGGCRTGTGGGYSCALRIAGVSGCCSSVNVGTEEQRRGASDKEKESTQAVLYSEEAFLANVFALVSLPFCRTVGEGGYLYPFCHAKSWLSPETLRAPGGKGQSRFGRLVPLPHRSGMRWRRGCRILLTYRICRRGFSSLGEWPERISQTFALDACMHQKEASGHRGRCSTRKS